ncbi:hypothetical protein GOODEAATRI_011347 [Goodea atripinnis]|uniref:Chromo domain-containing protein n=1 Tax=Goodea atripinnis TaxID=208336 RepID=A0ABV0MGY0_9TELE
MPLFPLRSFLFHPTFHVFEIKPNITFNLHYLVDWGGFGCGEHSWVPARDIFDKDLIKDFYHGRPEQPGGPSGARP